MRRVLRVMVVVFAVVLLGVCAGASVAAASAPVGSPWWHLTSGSRPTNLEPEGQGELVVGAENLGDASADGESSPVMIVDTLPAGLKATAATGTVPDNNDHPSFPCVVEELGSRVSCTLEKLTEHSNVLPGIVPPYGQIEVRIAVEVGEAKTGELNAVSISGGGALERSLSHPIVVSESPTVFGVEDYELENEEVGGAADLQAGSHPFQQTTTIDLDQDADRNEHDDTTKPGEVAEVEPAGLAKDLDFQWPAGLIGNPTPIAQCSTGQFLTRTTPDGGTIENECPADTAVGVATVTVNEPHGFAATVFVVPLFNLEPQRGEPARFGFNVVVANAPVYIDTALRTGGDYGLTVESNNITQTAGFLSAKVTVWGTPDSPAHNSARGWGCLYAARGLSTESCSSTEVVDPPPFLVLPTACVGSLPSIVEGDSWSQPTPRTVSPLASFQTPPLDGCNQLQFSPTIAVTPDDGVQASKPTGLTVDVHVPQEVSTNAAGTASSNVGDIAVKLPAGVAVNPSGANGLEACSEGLVGFTGVGEVPTDPGVSRLLFSPYLPDSIAALAAGDEELREPGKNVCPDASKIGEVTIHSPLLPADQPVKGFVYLASQEANPFDSVLAMYIVAEDPVSGSLVKLPGEVQICQGAGEVIAGMTCETTGQLISTFESTPQLAFEDADLHFFGGELAPLASPTRCGTYKTEAIFTPWSGTPPVKSTSSFNITSGPHGAACPGSVLPFSPSLTGGATNIQAGAFSPFTLTMSRSDGEQNLQSVEATLPPGLSGILSNVELCPEPQANTGACGPNSLIGETTISVGVGSRPFTVSGGKFYLTGPYNGTSGCTVGTAGCAPFGITFEVPAKAGPFDLAKTARNHPACDCVLVRGKIEINPYTAAIKIVSNPPGTTDSIPTSLEGIPLEIQKVNAITTRQNFQFNPTNCGKLAVAGTIHSSEGGTDTIDVPLQVTNCAALKFTPKFAVSATGHTTKALGAGLTAKVTEPVGAFGTQANITRVKVDLPIKLPSQLKTLQKACPAKTFEEGFEQCLKTYPHSKVGEAVVYTPILPVPLKGPAIFVSHGGEAFPSLTIVLQGYGVTVDLVGATDIKKGITSTTFKTVPDVPFTSFELTLPQGQYAALASNLPEADHGNLCGQNLKMPTEFLAQNGAKINEDTTIAVNGCAKTKTLTRAQKLQKALKACRSKDHKKAKREQCETTARKKDGPPKKKTAKRKA